MQATQGKLEYSLQLIQAYCLKQASKPDPDEEGYCYCCGRGDRTLTPCPRCGEALCQDCLDDGAHLCEVE